ncbi:MAG: von Willebrand factor type A domain-containing protein [Ardenticatenia bacterium]|nr:von Willebrand factor type A domain-containing protein [Ardenticatenia bacterium]
MQVGPEHPQAAVDAIVGQSSAMVSPNSAPSSAADAMRSAGIDPARSSAITSPDLETSSAPQESLRYQPDDSLPTPLWPPAPYPDLPPPGASGEGYAAIVENPFLDPVTQPLSTFGVDVDSASYANVRRFVSQMGVLPPPDAVRIEELVNAFSYDYPAPPTGARDPFAVHVEIADAPWAREHRLVKIGIKGQDMSRRERPAANLVFLIDVSGSMQDANKLPLAKTALGMLVEELGAGDRVAIVTYAGQSGLALESTDSRDRSRITDAIEGLQAGGGTNGSGGIQLAYQVARSQYRDDGVNRVILLTDGDFNVGVTDDGALEDLISREASSGVFLSVLGFGMGNLQDGRLERLADRGNGNYGYIDGPDEAQRLLVDQLTGTLVTIAKDVKLQVEFNPSQVAAYRLIGYENRRLAAQDFADDRKDAGEIGAGHTVTALYEVLPIGADPKGAGLSDLRYQRPRREARGSGSDDLLYLKLRYKTPEGDTSRLLEAPVKDRGDSLRSASVDFHFAAALAAFGMVLRDSEHRGEASMAMVEDLAGRGGGGGGGGGGQVGERAARGDNRQNAAGRGARGREGVRNELAQSRRARHRDGMSCPG